MDQLEYIKIPLHGKYGEGKFTLVDSDYDGEYFSRYKWYVSPNGYVVRKPSRYEGLNYNTYVYLHHEVCKVPVGKWRDHINRNKLDNRTCNLRPVSYKESARNRNQLLAPTKRTGSSPFRGVSKHYNKWIGSCGGKYLGLYDTALEAAKAYDDIALKKMGKDCNLKFSNIK